jgi:hypothetical protein
VTRVLVIDRDPLEAAARAARLRALRSASGANHRRTAHPPKRRSFTMNTAVSIPDDVFDRAERLARRTKKSRSQLFSDAVKE